MHSYLTDPRSTHPDFAVWPVLQDSHTEFFCLHDCKKSEREKYFWCVTELSDWLTHMKSTLPEICQTKWWSVAFNPSLSLAPIINIANISCLPTLRSMEKMQGWPVKILKWHHYSSPWTQNFRPSWNDFENLMGAAPRALVISKQRDSLHSEVPPWNSVWQKNNVWKTWMNSIILTLCNKSHSGGLPLSPNQMEALKPRTKKFWTEINTNSGILTKYVAGFRAAFEPGAYPNFLADIITNIFIIRDSPRLKAQQ